MKQRLKSIRPPVTPRVSVTISMTIIAMILSALAGVIGNLASATIPDGIKPYLSYSWLVLGVLVLLGIIITTWQIWYSSGQTMNSSSASTPPSRPSLPSSGSSMAATSLAPVTLPTASPAPVAGSSLYHTCVISYATEDERFAKKLYADLQAQGVSCWLADQDGRLGDKLRAEIYQAIRQLDKLILVLSQNAIESQWVEEEVDVALDREHQQPVTFLLFPLRLDEAVFTTEKYWAITVRQRRIGDFRQWQQDTEYQQALQRLLRDLHV